MCKLNTVIFTFVKTFVLVFNGTTSLFVVEYYGVIKRVGVRDWRGTRVFEGKGGLLLCLLLQDLIHMVRCSDGCRLSRRTWLTLRCLSRNLQSFKWSFVRGLFRYRVLSKSEEKYWSSMHTWSVIIMKLTTKLKSLIVVMYTSFLPNLITTGWKLESWAKLICAPEVKYGFHCADWHETHSQWTCLPNFILMGRKFLYAPLSKAGLPPQRFPRKSLLMNEIT